MTEFQVIYLFKKDTCCESERDVERPKTCYEKKAII